jgi:ChrR Cupin-like domain
MAPVILHPDEMPWEVISRGRTNSIRRKLLPLDSGAPGVTVELSYMIVPDGYGVPRHRHNCDQIRYILGGTQNIGPNHDMLPGECGFFPEGAHYGPQAQKGDCLCLLLQFQGASGDRLLTSDELNATYAKMIAEGAVFENGIYRGRKPDGTPENKDSYAAIYEAHEGRKLAFARPRYREPVMMFPDRFRWTKDRHRPGIETKSLGTFTEQRTSVSLVRILPNAMLNPQPDADAEIRFVIDGTVDIGGRHCRNGTYLFIPTGATAPAMQSPSGATFFSIMLPMLRELAAPVR